MRLRTLAFLAALAVAGGFLVASSGLVSIAASSGHYWLTGWLLHYTMRRAVQTQSAFVEAPPGGLDEPGLIALGAVHYEDGCAPCHGAPGEPRSPVMLAMTPQPPWLPEKVPSWQPEHLFWIVRHGVKYTGMPAWPAQARPDEVWAVVAFLLALPDLDAVAYRRLVAGPMTLPPGEPEELETILAGCARCHGQDGAGRPEGGVPWIGGQERAYLAATLRAYAEGRRASGIMQPQVAALPAAQLDRLADHYARQPWVAAAGTVPDGRGAQIAREGIPARGVPACASCHREGARADYPRIEGQREDFIARQLMLLRDGARGGTTFGHLMPVFAHRLTDADIAAVATYYARGPSDGRPD